MLVGAASRMFYDLQLHFQNILGNSAEAHTKIGMIMAIAGVVAALIGAPISGYIIDRYKNYKRVIAVVMTFLIVIVLAVAPFIRPETFGEPSGSIKFAATKTTLMLMLVVSPLIGLGYSYRNVLDPFASTYAQNNKVPISITRGFYAIGAGAMSVGILTVIKHAGSSAKFIDSFYIFLMYAGLLGLVLVYLLIFMTEPTHGKYDAEDKKDRSKFKVVFKNKVFWFGIIASFFAIGMMESLESVNKAIAQDKSVDHPGEWGVVEDTILYMDLIRAIPEAILFMFTSIVIMKIGIRKSGIIGCVIFAIVACVMAFAMKTDNRWLYIIVSSLIGPFAGAMIIGLGYEFVVAVSHREVRGVATTVFNALTYGLGGVVFILLGNAFEKSLGYKLLFIYAGMIVIPLLIYVFLIPKGLRTKLSLQETLHSSHEDIPALEKKYEKYTYKQTRKNTKYANKANYSKKIKN